MIVIGILIFNIVGKIAERKELLKKSTNLLNDIDQLKNKIEIISCVSKDTDYINNIIKDVEKITNENKIYNKPTTDLVIINELVEYKNILTSVSNNILKIQYCK